MKGGLPSDATLRAVADAIADAMVAEVPPRSIPAIAVRAARLTAGAADFDPGAWAVAVTEALDPPAARRFATALRVARLSTRGRSAARKRVAELAKLIEEIAT